MEEGYKVSTIREVMGPKTKIIQTCLASHPEGASPKTLARETGLNVNTVKSILPKLRGVKKVMRGVYKVVEGGDGIPSVDALTDWNFHNCVLTTNISGALLSKERIYSLYKNPKVFEWGLVKCAISASKDGKATCRVSSDFPLNVSSLSFVAGFFSTQVNAHWSRIDVSTIEFNKDYRNLRLDGVNSISIGGLVEQFKLYQKKRGLRIEHKTKVPLGVQSIVDMLSQNPMSLDHNVKLQQQREELNRLTRAANQNSQLLIELLNTLKRVQY